MKIASVAHVKAEFSAYVKATDSGPVVITRNGKAVAAIVPLKDDDDVERLLMGYSPKLRSILNSAKKRIRKGHSISHEDFWERIESGQAKSRRKTA
jgi:prevent-host-death family protein